MKRFLFLLALLLAGLAPKTDAAQYVDMVLGGNQGTPTVTAFRNANFAIHIGCIEDENGLPLPGLTGLKYEYCKPWDYMRTQWLRDVTGETWPNVHVTNFSDFSKPEDRAAYERALTKWCAQIGTKRVHFDCIMECPTGKDPNGIPWVNHAAELVEETAALGFRVMPNNGDPYTAGKTLANAVTETDKAWARINQAAAIICMQVAVDFDHYNFSRFIYANWVVSYYVSINKSVIVGAYTTNGTDEIKAKQFFGSAIFSNPLVYAHYNVSLAPTNAGVQIPGGTPVKEPTGLPTGVNVDLTARGPLYAPANNWWNVDVTNAPVDPNSAAIVAFIKSLGNNGYLHPDFNRDYGISLTSVASGTPLVPVTFNRYPSESDKGWNGKTGYPIPEAAKTDPKYFENHEPGGGEGDGHLLLFDGTQGVIFELAYCSWDGTKWVAGCGAIFDVNSNYRRPEGWTSTDAAGLAIGPGLIRADEVFGPGPIRHALRYSVHRIGKAYSPRGYVYPASHEASLDAGAPPLGMRIRLKASKDISGYRPEVRKVLQALKTYGAICADRGGSSVNFQGTQDQRFDPAIWNPAFHGLTISDFEVIKLGWQPTP